MRTLMQDIRFGARMLCKNWGFTAIAVMILTLGVGINTAMFSFIHAIQSQPKKLANLNELVYVWGLSKSEPVRVHRRVSLMDMNSVASKTDAFREIGLYDFDAANISLETGEPQRARLLRASSNLPTMLGYEAQIGRLHSKEEDSSSADAVTVITHRMWQRQFASSTDVLGTTITIDGEPHTVVGVLPEKFDAPLLWESVDMLTPLRFDESKLARNQRGYSAIARLADGVSIEQAESRITAVASRMGEAYPDTNHDTSFWVQSVNDYVRPFAHRMFEKALLLAVGLVLLIGCMNLANLMIAKAASRNREFAIRAALGAGRTRLVRQLLTESAIVAIMGGIIGTIAGSWAISILANSIEQGPVSATDVTLSGAVLGYGLLLALGSALLFGLTPALMASRVSLSESLKDGTSTTTSGAKRGRLRNAFVVVQLALALPLLVASGLVTRHLVSLQSADMDLEAENVLTAHVDLPAYRYDSDAQKAEFFRKAVENIGSTPGVEYAGATSSFPIAGSSYHAAEFLIEGTPLNTEESPPYAYIQSVTPDYCRAMNLPLVSGRHISKDDLAGAQRVALINEYIAKKYWPGESAIGHRIQLKLRGAEDEWTTIVGVLGQVSHPSFGSSEQGKIYLPLEQYAASDMTIVAKTQGPARSLESSLRATIHNLDPELPVYGISTAKERIERWLNDDSIMARLLAGISLLALLLSSIGLYGVMSYAVTQQTHEIGVRLALGAGPGAILRMIFRRCLALAGLGLVIGLLLSAPMGLAISSQLYGVGGLDPITFAGVSLVLLCVTLAASFFPARRAMTVDPITALRCN